MPSTQSQRRRASTGESCSPRPVPRATPPSRLNGTSLPSSAARVARSPRVARVPQSASSATSAAAASALPPASPAANGIDLSISRWASAGTPACRASSSAACQTRLRRSTGTAAGPRPVSAPSPRTVSESPSAGRTVTVSNSETARKTVCSSWKPSARSGPTPRVTFTFAGARAATAPLPASRPGPPEVAWVTGPPCLPVRSRASVPAGDGLGAGQPGEVGHRQLLPAGGGVDAGGTQPGLGRRGAAGPPGERGPQPLAPGGEGGVDDGEGGGPVTGLRGP